LTPADQGRRGAQAGVARDAVDENHASGFGRPLTFGMNIQQSFMVPPPLATVDLAMQDGAVIRLRRYGRPGATRLALSHGNGLAINAYAPFWLPLARDYDLVVFDMRNHGENPLHDPKAHNYKFFCSDIGEIYEGIRSHFGPARCVGVFHSLSSIAAMLHTLKQGKCWDALCVFDPPIMPPVGHPLHEVEHVSMEKLAQRALRRHTVYDSPEQLATLFRRQASFARWVPEGPDLLARYTLRPMPDGRWTLCCPPECEAVGFRDNADPTLYPRLGDYPVPLRIIAGDPASPFASPAAAAAKAAHDELGVDYAMVPRTTHFLQIEEPQVCRDLLIDFLKRHGLDNPA
jgi:pimeloyl-ACP methyl ester carboxylesterase